MQVEGGTARTQPQRAMQTEGDGDKTMRKNVLIKAKDVARKIRSFDHFIYVWSQKGKYYVPPKNYLTWHFIAQVLSKEKRLLRLEQVGPEVDIPKVHGTWVNEMYHDNKATNSLSLYFPDISDVQNVPRKYFFNVSLIRC